MRISSRTGGIAAIMAGLGYLVQATMGLIRPQTEVFSSTSDYILEVVFIVALVATIFGLIGLYPFLKSHDDRAATLGLWLALTGTGLMGVSALATFLAAQNALGPPFLGGIMLALLGYILLGVTALRTKALPLPEGLALIFGFPLSIFLSTLGGGILFGLTWLGVGYSLLKQ